MTPTMAFSRFGSCSKFQTIMKGKIEKVQSPTHVIAEYAYTVPVTIDVGKQVPSAPVSLVQKYCEGLHWKMKMKKNAAL